METVTVCLVLRFCYYGLPKRMALRLTK